MTAQAETGKTEKGVSAPAREAQQTRYLSGVARTGTLTAGCKAARVSPNTVYRWREDAAFAEAESIARDTFTDGLEQEAVRRAWRGTRKVKPIYVRGELVGEVIETEYSDTLMVLMLKALRPEKYRERKETQVTAAVAVEHKVVVSDDSAQLLADLIAAGLATRDNSRTFA